jgi:hypothetical protein
VDRTQLVSRLLAKARKYRDFARWIGDQETSRRIRAMAEERIRRAVALARPNEKRIRKPRVKFGKKMANRSGGMWNFGSKPNANFMRPNSLQRTGRHAGGVQRRPDQGGSVEAYRRHAPESKRGMKTDKPVMTDQQREEIKRLCHEADVPDGRAAYT